VTSFFFRPLQKICIFFRVEILFPILVEFQVKKKDRLFFFLFLEEEGRFFVDRFKLFPPTPSERLPLVFPPQQVRK
jgi:hypothetical protein